MQRRAIVKVVGSEVRQGKREGFSYWVPVDGDTEMEAIANAKCERIRMGVEVTIESVEFLIDAMEEELRRRKQA